MSTANWLGEHSTSLGWTFLAWALLIAVWGGIAYRRWQRREHEDAAETVRKLQLVKPYTVDHSQDAL